VVRMQVWSRKENIQAGIRRLGTRLVVGVICWDIAGGTAAAELVLDGWVIHLAFKQNWPCRVHFMSVQKMRQREERSPKPRIACPNSRPRTGGTSFRSIVSTDIVGRDTSRRRRTQ
jgi:hypothetical protein